MKSSCTLEHMVEVPKQIFISYSDSYKSTCETLVVIFTVIVETNT